MRLFKIVFVILVGISLGAKRTYAGKGDGITSLTSLGTGILFQSIEIKKHFRVDLETKGGFRGAEEKAQSLLVGPPPTREIPLVWTLGIGYGRGTSSATPVDPSISNSIMTYMGGAIWEVTPRLNISGRAGYDKISVENYEHGVGTLKFEYIYSLPKRGKIPRDEEIIPEYEDDEEDEPEEEEVDATQYDPEDARQYYRYQQALKEAKEAEMDESRERERKIAEVPTYPQLRVSYELGFNRHAVGVKTFSRPSNLGRTPSTATVNQYYDGPQVSYLPNRKWIYTLALGLYRYAEDPMNLLNQMESGDAQRQSIMGGVGWPGYATRSLAFPTTIIRGTIGHILKRNSSFTFSIEKASYASPNIPTTFTFNPVYYRDFKNSWRAGLGIHGTFGGLNSPFMVGTLELNYRF